MSCLNNTPLCFHSFVVELKFSSGIVERDLDVLCFTKMQTCGQMGAQPRLMLKQAVRATLVGICCVCKGIKCGLTLANSAFQGHVEGLSVSNFIFSFSLSSFLLFLNSSHN